MMRVVGKMSLIPDQKTVKTPVTLEGTGLHSGAPVRLIVKPAVAGSGISFLRTDVPRGRVEARYDNVCDTRLGTTIRNEDGVTVSTIEHLMSALWGAGIDNALIELDGPEVPIMDGSAAPFLEAIDRAGVRLQATPRRVIEILRPVTVKDGDALLTLTPAEGFSMTLDIAFDHDAIGRQSMTLDFSDEQFRYDIAAARTFGFAHEVDMLRKAGLARGGSLKNAIVIGEQGILNEEGLRFNDEFVRHKVLDCVGDLFLAGAHIRGHVTASRTGHTLNNKALHALFADAANWRDADTAAPLAETGYVPAAAAM